MTATIPANAIAPLYSPSSPPGCLGTNPIQPNNIKIAVPNSSAKNINTSFCHGCRSYNWLGSAVPKRRNTSMSFILMRNKHYIVYLVL